MAEQVRATRLGFLYLASLFGLVVMVWGLVTGGVGAVHYARPDLGGARLNEDRQARRFQSTLELLIRAGVASSGTTSNLNQLFPTPEEQKADEEEEIKDEALSDVFKGGSTFLAGWIVLMVGTARARRVLGAGREDEVAVSFLAPTPTPAPSPEPKRPSFEPPRPPEGG